MARAEHAFEAISAYTARLQPDLFGGTRTRRRIAEEVRAHLEEKTEHYISSGVSPDEAEHRAIEDFGPHEVVVNSWAESKGIGMATNFTRYGGLAGIIGALALVTSGTFAEYSESFGQGWFAEIATAAAALIGVALVAVYMRLRGKIVPYGRLGFRLLIAGVPVALVSSSLWFAPGAYVGMAASGVGLLLMIVGSVRAHVLPAAPFLLWAAGFAVGGIVGLAGAVTDVDTGPIAGGITWASVAIGWIWLGAHLWSERPPVEKTDTPVPA